MDENKIKHTNVFTRKDDHKIQGNKILLLQDVSLEYTFSKRFSFDLFRRIFTFVFQVQCKGCISTDQSPTSKRTIRYVKHSFNLLNSQKKLWYVTVETY